MTLPGENTDPALVSELTQALAQGPAQAWQALAEALMRLRPMDPAGAQAVLEREPRAGELAARGAGAAQDLAALLQDLARARRCLGCGTCCRTSSPTLYAEDLERVRAGGLELDQLLCLRPGERAASARQGGTVILEHELIKLAEGPKGGCLHLTPQGCAIYPHRPLQCRHLECFSGRHAGQLEDRPRLTRADLLAGDETTLALMEEYDARLPADALRGDLEAAAQGDAQAASRALAALELDHRLRHGAQSRHGMSPGRLALMWGRPAVAVARSHGLAPRLGAGGAVELARQQPAPGWAKPA